MVDNFEQISNLLNFESEDDFYFLQIIQRKKDNPDGYMGSNNSSRLIKAYYIKSVEELNKKKHEITELCKLFNARAGINLNKRSFYKTSFNVLKKTAEYIHNRDFKSTAYVWNTECGKYNGGDKIWLLDVDDKDNWNLEHNLIKFIRRAQPHNGKKIIAKIPSKNGYHFITKGFDLRGFKETFPNVEIHKNNPTNLYIP